MQPKPPCRMLKAVVLLCLLLLAACSSGGSGGGNDLPADGQVLPPPPADNPADGDDPTGGNNPVGGGPAPNDDDTDGASPPDNDPGAGGTPPANNLPPDLTGAHLVVSPSPVTLPAGGDLPLLAIVVGSDGVPVTARTARVSWQSDNNDVATIDEFGLLRGVQPGQANIVATVNHAADALQATTAVTVTRASTVLGIDITPSAVSLRVGETRSLLALARNRTQALPQNPCGGEAQLHFNPQFLAASLNRGTQETRLVLEALAPGATWVGVECDGLRSASAWVEITNRPTIPALPAPGHFGEDVSLGVRGNELFLASFERSAGQLIYHHFTTAWQSEFPAASGRTHGRHAQLTFDSRRAGQPTICADDQGNVACWLRSSEGAWSRVTVRELELPTDTTATPLRAAIGADGTLYVLYYSVGDSTLHLATSRAATRDDWQDLVLLRGRVGALDIAVAPDQTARVALEYSDGAYYGAPTAGGWRFERVDGQPAAGAHLRLALGRDWRPQLVYLRGNALMHAEKRAGSWRVNLVQRFAAAVPQGLSVTLSEALRPRIGYVDLDQGAVHLISQLASVQMGAPNGWRDELWIPGPDKGPDHALISDEFGRAHIAYYDAQTGTAQVYSEPLMPTLGSSYVPPVEASSNAGVETPAMPSPATLAATAGNGSVQLTWNAVAGASSYSLYWSNTPGVSPDSDSITGITTNSFEHAERLNGLTYYYAVSAVGALGESALSDEVSATPQLPSPIQVRVVGDVGRNTLQWNPVPGASAYTVHWNTTGSPGANDPSIVLTDAETSFVHVGVRDDEIHYYAISAADGYSEGPLSEAVASLPAPASVTATSPYQDGTVEVNWAPVPGATGYNVYFSQDPGVSRETAQVITNVTAPFVHGERPHGTTWYYAVAALNATAESALSAEVSVQATVAAGPVLWRRISPLSTPRFMMAAAGLNGSIYSIGGFDGETLLDTVEVYTPANDRWQTLASLPAPRRELAAAGLEGKLYALGGWLGSAVTTKLEIYDAATDTWNVGRPMPTARSNLVAATVGSKLYAIGGWNGTYLKTVEIYDPASNTWSRGPDMPTARNAMASAVIGGKIFVIGGWADGRALTTVEVFDTEAATWSTLAPLPVARNRLTAGVILGKIYAVGGWTGSDPLNRVDVYDPRTASWSEGVPMPTARNGHAASVANNRLYALGGWNGSRYLNTVEALGVQ